MNASIRKGPKGPKGERRFEERLGVPDESQATGCRLRSQAYRGEPERRGESGIERAWLAAGKALK